MSTMNHTLATGWQRDPARLAVFLRWLEERCEITTLANAIDVIEEPWHYEAEYDRMCREEMAVTA